MDPFVKLMTLAQMHGCMEGSEAEVTDLRELCLAMWDQLWWWQRRAVLKSEAAENIRAAAHGDI